MLPPLRQTTKASDDVDFGAHSRSFGICSPTLRVSRCHSRARLASGWLAGLYREGVEPSGSLRKVSDYMVIPLSCPPDATCTFAPLLDPGRTDVPLPWRSHRCCPRLTRQRGLRTMHISGLTHAASAPALLRFALHVAARAQGWLPAGRLAFTGRASNPLDRYERFQIVRHSPFLAS